MIVHLAPAGRCCNCSILWAKATRCVYFDENQVFKLNGHKFGYKKEKCIAHSGGLKPVFSHVESTAAFCLSSHSVARNLLIELLDYKREMHIKQIFLFTSHLATGMSLLNTLQSLWLSHKKVGDGVKITELKCMLGANFLVVNFFDRYQTFYFIFLL